VKQQHRWVDPKLLVIGYTPVELLQINHSRQIKVKDEYSSSQSLRATEYHLPYEICHLTEVNVPHQARQYSIYLPWPNGRLNGSVNYICMRIMEFLQLQVNLVFVFLCFVFM